MNEREIRYRITRSIVIPNTCIKIESSHTVVTRTDNPFRTAGVVRKMFPGWKIADVDSNIDRDYKELFGEE